MTHGACDAPQKPFDALPDIGQRGLEPRIVAKIRVGHVLARAAIRMIKEQFQPGLCIGRSDKPKIAKNAAIERD